MDLTEQALQPYSPGSTTRPATSTEPGLSRRTSVANRSSSSLTRRRSLLATPGLATRNSPADGHRRTWNSWTRPQLDPQDEAKWRHREVAKASAPTVVAAPALAEQGRESPDPRAQTPVSMEYSHLGSLELGSLRIANGEASPAASLHWYSSQSTSRTDEYFLPDAWDSPLMMKSTKKRHHVRSKSAMQPVTPPLDRTLRVFDDVRRSKTISRYGTPTRPKSPEQPQQWQEHHQTHSQDLEMESEPIRRLRVMNKSQDTIATTLGAQLEDCDEPSVPTGHIIIQDHDEGFISNDPTPLREQDVRILDGTIFGEPAVVKATSTTGTPSASSTSSSPRMQPEKKRPPPKKADSGYSSGDSFKAKHCEAGKPGRIPTVCNKPPTATDLPQSDEDGSENSANLYTSQQVLHSSTSRSTLSTPGAVDRVTSHVISRHRSHENVKNTLILDTSLPEDWNIDDLSLSTRAPKTPKSPTSFMSKFSADSKVSIHKRLQKSKPSFQELPVVQSCDSIPERSIPTIPIDVRKQFVRRLSETPGMEYLTHTYPTKHHVNSEEPESELPALEPIKFPSPPATPEQGRHHKRAATERPSLRFKRSLSLFRRKSKAKGEVTQPSLPDEASLPDLGTTAASLGPSPYDVALGTAHQARVTSPTYPHQIGDALPRTKSMVTMDAKTAAKLARSRSKDRAQFRPEMPLRPRSYYSEREGMLDADIYRRHSFYGHVPPMPTIPSIGNLGAASRANEQQPPVPDLQPTQSKAGPNIRTRSTGRGRVVTPLIEKFDQYGHPRSNTMTEPMTYQQLNHVAKINAGQSYSTRGRTIRKEINHPDWA